MSSFLVTLDGERVELVEADTYQQEGPMTTFFRTRAGSAVVDSWSDRLASYRTAGLVAVRRLEEVEQVGAGGVLRSA